MTQGITCQKPNGKEGDCATDSSKYHAMTDQSKVR